MAELLLLMPKIVCDDSRFRGPPFSDFRVSKTRMSRNSHLPHDLSQLTAFF